MCFRDADVHEVERLAVRNKKNLRVREASAASEGLNSSKLTGSTRAFFIVAG